MIVLLPEQQMNLSNTLSDGKRLPPGIGAMLVPRGHFVGVASRLDRLK